MNETNGKGQMMGMDGALQAMSTPARPAEMPGSGMAGQAATARTAAASADQMPSGAMDAGASGGQMADSSTPGVMAEGDDAAPEAPTGTQENVLVELRVPTARAALSAFAAAATVATVDFQVDPNYEPVPLIPPASEGAQPRAALSAPAEQTVIIRGTIDPNKIAELEAQPNVVKVWRDTPIAPFGVAVREAPVEQPVDPDLSPLADTPPNPLTMALEPMGSCPIGTCDCSPGTPKGSIADVANYLGVNQIWAAGHRGAGIVVGVVDGGITAAGRAINASDTRHPQWPNKLIARVIGGWPTANWGTTGVTWGWHGNMCATDVLGMAPDAQLYDIRIAEGNAISSALAGFQWAINQHRTNGTPHILTNSWGIFQEAWDTVYARNPNHPFTRKVVEAIQEGIVVLFAAGNCGGTCPDGRCGTDSGPGKSIWGANSHPDVITVGAVNRHEQFVGYSSQGPGALDPLKPDFCSVTHFTGFFNSDSGTSAATPIAAGVTALLKQANPGLAPGQLKTILQKTTKGIGPAGWDQHSGYGILRAKVAHSQIVNPSQWWDWESLGGFCTDGVGVSSWSSERLDCFVVGNDRQLWHKWFAGGWSGWEGLGGNLYSAPAAVSWGPDRIDVFALGGDHAMWHRWWDGAAWHGWESLGGFCTDGVGVSSWAPNRLDCFVVGNDRQLWHKWWDGASWSGWEALGGNLYSAPTAVSWGPNRIDVFALGGDHAMWHKWWDGASWSGWESLGGFCTDGVGVASWAPGRLDCFVIGNDRQLWHKWYDNGWSGWEALGGNLYSAPTAVSWGYKRIDIMALGGDHAMWHKWYG
uniref:Uncharacterized protein n=1 Tax=uncultured bacterium A1Q1_fos_485 TaxID=1256576 RepID=L7VUC4_9BACT|nr:hypothetical protein [uncultured bacterium A1Q1_fos_485]